MLFHRPSQRSSAISFVSLSAFALVAATSLIVLGVRVSAVLSQSGQFVSTTGGESISIYNILKTQSQIPLYEDPRIPPNYPTTLYNAGFYRFYAFVDSLFSKDRSTVVMRLTTLSLACVGMFSLFAYALLALRDRKPAASVATTVAMCCAAVSASFSSLVGWWLVTTRPDVGAVACCAVALACILGLGQKRFAGISAGVFLAAAWSFKQSCILIYVGLIFSALFQRRYRLAAALALPTIVVAGIFLTALGPDYRYNAFVATSFSNFELANLGRLIPRVILKGGLPLFAAIAALIFLPNLEWVRRDEKITLVSCWSTTLLGGLVTCCRNGSELNYFFEFWVVAGFLTVISAKVVTQSVETSAKPRAALFVRAGLAFVALCTAGFDTCCLTAIGPFGTAWLEMSEEQRNELDEVKIAAVELAEDGAVFCQPALTGLAWNLPFPTYNFDDNPYFHKPALKRGALHGGGFSGLIADHHFRMIVAETDNRDLIKEVEEAGYLRQNRWSHFAVYIDPSLKTWSPDRASRHQDEHPATTRFVSHP